jgi:hypothetical protein
VLDWALGVDWDIYGGLCSSEHVHDVDDSNAASGRTSDCNWQVQPARRAVITIVQTQLCTVTRHVAVTDQPAEIG